MIYTIDIPPAFRQDPTQSLHTRCVMCEKELIESNSPYLIEKSYVKPLGMAVYETLFEYAICMDCAVQMRAQMSRESLQRMDSFMAEGLAHDHRQLPDDFEEAAMVDQWLQHCALSGQPIEALTEYQMIAVCQGDQMMVSPDEAHQRMPIVIGGPAIAELTELLSPETREEMDRFRDLLGGVPPEWEALLQGRPVVV